MMADRRSYAAMPTAAVEPDFDRRALRTSSLPDGARDFLAGQLGELTA
jgi:hypothetical protein